MVPAFAIAPYASRGKNRPPDSGGARLQRKARDQSPFSSVHQERSKRTIRNRCAINPHRRMNFMVDKSYSFPLSLRLQTMTKASPQQTKTKLANGPQGSLGSSDFRKR